MWLCANQQTIIYRYPWRYRTALISLITGAHRWSISEWRRVDRPTLDSCTSSAWLAEGQSTVEVGPGHQTTMRGAPDPRYRRPCIAPCHYGDGWPTHADTIVWKYCLFCRWPSARFSLGRALIFCWRRNCKHATIVLFSLECPLGRSNPGDAANAPTLYNNFFLIKNVVAKSKITTVKQPIVQTDGS